MHQQTCEPWGGARDNQYNESSFTQQSEESETRDFDEISECQE
jgi:hypothetical protein